jgi:hypothetical protein
VREKLLSGRADAPTTRQRKEIRHNGNWEEEEEEEEAMAFMEIWNARNWMFQFWNSFGSDVGWILVGQ